MTWQAWLALWILGSLLAAAAWAEHQREWKRRRPTLRLHTPTVTPTLDNARLIQVLRKRDESIDGAVKAHLDDVMGSEQCADCARAALFCVHLNNS